MPSPEGTYGLLAEFDTPGDLVRAVRQAREDGWRRMDCYTPYPVEEAAEAIGFHRNRVPLVTLVGALMGLAAMFSMETWVSVIAYPLNIAGRPLYSWPAFIVPAYEWTILWAGLSAAFGMLALNGLPQLYHPLFNAPNFRNGATTDKFFLCLEALDPKFDLVAIEGIPENHRARFDRGGGVLMQILHMTRNGVRMNEHGCPIHATSFRRMGGKALAFAGLSAIFLIAGCRQDMQNQPKMIPQRGSDFYADHRGARPQVVNTVARGQLQEDSYFYTGVIQGANGYREEQNTLPFPVTMEVLERGQERFNVYCTPCHSRVGNGLGEIVDRGYKPAANLHDQVRRAQPLSHYFYVMTHGYGAMPDYREQLTPEDRWAVAAYIRALQLSQAASRSDVPSGVQVQSLKDLATQQGHPEYAQPWTLPATAVQAYPPDQRRNARNGSRQSR